MKPPCELNSILLFDLQTVESVHIWPVNMLQPQALSILLPILLR